VAVIALVGGANLPAHAQTAASEGQEQYAQFSASDSAEPPPYEAIKGKGTNALILGAGAAYAGKKIRGCPQGTAAR